MSGTDMPGYGLIGLYGGGGSPERPLAGPGYDEPEVGNAPLGIAQDVARRFYGLDEEDPMADCSDRHDR